MYKMSLCGQVVRVPGYRYRGLGLIPDATRFSEKELLERKSNGSGLEI
jgi:hypothetical protein